MITDNDQQDYDQADVTTQEEIPSAPEGITVTATSDTSLDISWKAPVTAALCVDYYTISVWSEGNTCDILHEQLLTTVSDGSLSDHDNVTTVTSDQTSVTITDLTPCTSYQTMITPVTRNNNTGDTGHESAVTQSTDPGHKILLSWAQQS